MASVETIFIINFLLNIAIAVSGIIVSMLIPSTKKIKAGEAGSSLGASWIPIVLVIMIIVAIAVFPLSFLSLEGRNLYFALVLDIIAIGVTGLAFREFISARKAYKELGEGEVVEEVGVVASTPSPQAYQQQPVQVPKQHPYQTQVQMMTVECPQCGNHIQLAEGSHTITCPYCGLSGTI
jgi:ribosomal protein S27E